MSVGGEALELVERLTGIWWPAADERGLRQAAAEYRQLAGEIEEVAAAGQAAVQAVAVNNTGTAIDQFGGFWARYQAGDGWLPRATEACRELAAALDRYADAVEQAKDRLLEEIALLGGVLIAGAALAVFTAGASQAAAAAASAAIVATAEAIGVALSTLVAEIVATVLVGAAFGALESMAVNLLVAQPMQVAFDQQQGIDWDEALAWAEGGALGGAVAGGLGGAIRGAGRAATWSATVDPRLATALDGLPTGTESLLGGAVVGATANAGAGYVTNGDLGLADLVGGAVGGAAGGRAAAAMADPLPGGMIRSGRGFSTRRTGDGGSDEKAIADFLVAEGRDVWQIRRSNEAGRLPDAMVDGRPTEFKTINTDNHNAIQRTLWSSRGQADRVVLDARETGQTTDGVVRAINEYLRTPENRVRTQYVRVLGNGFEVIWRPGGFQFRGGG